jgi:hypothetical protein
VRPLELTEAVALIKAIDSNWSLRCTGTAEIGAQGCGLLSPAARHHGETRELALAAGWRVWGPDDPELLNGEVLCPRHRELTMAAVARRLAKGE